MLQRFIDLWTPKSGNTKTGNVPTMSVGATVDETRQSCEGCPLLDQGCYAHCGTPILGLWSKQRSYRNGKDKSLAYALAKRHRDARMVRVSDIGDAGRIGKRRASNIVRMVTDASLKIVGYTHHWRERIAANAWKGILRASCSTLEEADEAIDRGWAATCIIADPMPNAPAHVARPQVVFHTPKGRKGISCPAQSRPGKLTCNQCLLCSGETGKVLVAFYVHGGQSAKIFTKATL